jgi:hypothetical protein
MARWSAIDDELRARFRWPVVPVDRLQRSVENLDRLATPPGQSGRWRPERRFAYDLRHLLAPHAGAHLTQETSLAMAQVLPRTSHQRVPASRPGAAAVHQRPRQTLRRFDMQRAQISPIRVACGGSDDIGNADQIGGSARFTQVEANHVA